MLQAIDAHSPGNAMKHIHNALDNLKSFAQYLENNLMEFMAYGPYTAPTVLTEGGQVMALMEDQEGLDRMREILRAIPMWGNWTGPNLDELDRDMVRYRNIREAVRENPGCVQTDVKYLVSEVDGRKVATQIAYMERMGQIVRTQVGEKILLNMA